MATGTLNWAAQVASDDPDSQVADTIALMSRYVREDAQCPQVRSAVAEALSIKDEPAEAVFWYVKRLIRFERDEDIALPLSNSLTDWYGEIPVVEVLIRPRDMLTWRGDTGQGQVGDCDDYAMLTAAMLLSQGIPVAFVTVAADPAFPNQWSHVYVAAYPKGKRVALDTSHGAYPGWEADGVGRRQEWRIDAGLWGLLAAGVVVMALVGAFVEWIGKGRRNA